MWPHDEVLSMIANILEQARKRPQQSYKLDRVHPGRRTARKKKQSQHFEGTTKGLWSRPRKEVNPILSEQATRAILVKLYFP